MNKIPNNSPQGPAASAASGVNKIGFWSAKDCLYGWHGSLHGTLLPSLAVGTFQSAVDNPVVGTFQSAVDNPFVGTFQSAVDRPCP